MLPIQAKLCTKCGKPHTEATKNCAHCKAERKAWRDANLDTVRAYRKRHYVRKGFERQKARNAGIRQEVVRVLGSKCANPDCRWQNEDGTIGCTNPVILQVDHVNGGGTKERNALSYPAMYRKILNGATGYQLLCANCNWLKKVALSEHRV